MKNISGKFPKSNESSSLLDTKNRLSNYPNTVNFDSLYGNYQYQPKKYDNWPNVSDYNSYYNYDNYNINGYNYDLYLYGNKSNSKLDIKDSYKDYLGKTNLQPRQTLGGRDGLFNGYDLNLNKLENKEYSSILEEKNNSKNINNYNIGKGIYNNDNLKNYYNDYLNPTNNDYFNYFNDNNYLSDNYYNTNNYYNGNYSNYNFNNYYFNNYIWNKDGILGKALICPVHKTDIKDYLTKSLKLNHLEEKEQISDPKIKIKTDIDKKIIKENKDNKENKKDRETKESIKKKYNKEKKERIENKIKIKGSNNFPKKPLNKKDNEKKKRLKTISEIKSNIRKLYSSKTLNVNPRQYKMLNKSEDFMNNNNNMTQKNNKSLNKRKNKNLSNKYTLNNDEIYDLTKPNLNSKSEFKRYHTINVKDSKKTERNDNIEKNIDSKYNNKDLANDLKIETEPKIEDKKMINDIRIGPQSKNRSVIYDIRISADKKMVNDIRIGPQSHNRSVIYDIRVDSSKLNNNEKLSDENKTEKNNNKDLINENKLDKYNDKSLLNENKLEKYNDKNLLNENKLEKYNNKNLLNENKLEKFNKSLLNENKLDKFNNKSLLKENKLNKYDNKNSLNKNKLDKYKNKSNNNNFLNKTKSDRNNYKNSLKQIKLDIYNNKNISNENKVLLKEPKTSDKPIINDTRKYEKYNNKNSYNDFEIPSNNTLEENEKVKEHQNNIIIDISKKERVEKVYTSSINRTNNFQKNLLFKISKKECGLCHKQIDSHLYQIHYNGHATEVFKWLYLGTFDNACDLQELRRIKATHILNCAIECRNENLPRDIKELHLKIHDYEGYEGFEIFDLFERGSDFLNRCKMEGGVVLVHCMYGISRSVAFVIAYLIKYMRYTADSALKFLMEKRNKIKPNEGFMEQLYNYEKLFH